jgi:hypothetical protein
LFRCRINTGMPHLTHIIHPEFAYEVIGFTLKLNLGMETVQWTEYVEFKPIAAET